MLRQLGDVDGSMEAAAAAQTMCTRLGGQGGSIAVHLFDTAYHLPDAGLNEAIESRQDEMAAKKLMQENARQEADDGQP